MSFAYDEYLANHKANVSKGFYWMKHNIPEVFMGKDIPIEYLICSCHDNSKTDEFEYAAYDAYFYGKNRSHQVVQNFNRAWLTHIHWNRHHWQHWVLICDDSDEGTILIEIPHEYIIEMICDWWSFSWSKGNPLEIFKWYDEHKDYIQMNPKSKKTVLEILEKIKCKLI